VVDAGGVVWGNYPLNVCGDPVELCPFSINVLLFGAQLPMEVEAETQNTLKTKQCFSLC